MKEAVTAVFVHGDEVFVIRRQEYLRAFPGYYAFPGGKVDTQDAGYDYDHPLLLDHQPAHVRALYRELSEELGYDLGQALQRDEISGIQLVKSFRNEDHEIERFSQVNQVFSNSSWRIAKLSSIIHPFIDFIWGFARILIIAFGSYIIIEVVTGGGNRPMS